MKLKNRFKYKDYIGEFKKQVPQPNLHTNLRPQTSNQISTNTDTIKFNWVGREGIAESIVKRTREKQEQNRYVLTVRSQFVISAVIIIMIKLILRYER